MAEQITSLDQIINLRSAMANPATGDVSDTQLAQYLWLAEIDLAEMYEFSELRESEDVVTSAGTKDYEMAEADILRFLDPANNETSEIPMRLKSAYWDRKVGRLITGQGPPFFFYEEGRGTTNGNKKVRFRPEPDGVYTIRVPFMKVPTMPDHQEATISDLPQSHMLQVVSRAAEIALQMTAERDEASKQQGLTARTTYAARNALPKAGYYKRQLETFQKRMNRNRGRHGRAGSTRG